MHYWSEAYRDEFLSYLAAQDGVGGKRYLIDRVPGASYALSSDDDDDGAIKVICLGRAPWLDRAE
jgi:hypothetical protein